MRNSLIALMLSKLGMSLDDCLDQYQMLSRQIFVKKRSLCERLLGSDISKYSGKRLQTSIEALLRHRGYPHNMKLQDNQHPIRMHGYVRAALRLWLHCMDSIAECLLTDLYYVTSDPVWGSGSFVPKIAIDQILRMTWTRTWSSAMQHARHLRHHRTSSQWWCRIDDLWMEVMGKPTILRGKHGDIIDTNTI